MRAVKLLGAARVRGAHHAPSRRRAAVAVAAVLPIAAALFFVPIQVPVAGAATNPPCQNGTYTAGYDSTVPWR
jgi:hypothetical protein